MPRKLYPYVTIYVDRETKEYLASVAESHGMTISAFGEEAMLAHALTLAAKKKKTHSVTTP
jgi:hypothetical protein